MFANEISVIANVIPRASASWEISLEYAGNPPVAKPTTRPLATIVGKLRHGRNTRVREGLALKSLPTQTPSTSAPSFRHWQGRKSLSTERFAPRRNSVELVQKSFPITNDFRTETF